MPSLTIAWEYLSGYAVATNPASRDRAEWPPHPARVFMALAGAWFETEPPAVDNSARDDWDAEGKVLQWLERLGSAELHLPEWAGDYERSIVTVYVPVNDKAGPAAASLQSAPALTRSKQPRTFPRVWVGYDPCFLHWPDAVGVEQHRVALERLCRKVTRIGHSSSLVRMWLAHQDELARSCGERLVVDDLMPEVQTRSIAQGMLEMLVERFGGGPRRRFIELSDKIDELKRAKKAVSGRGALTREQKAAIDKEIQQLESEIAIVNPRPPVRPTVGLWSGYRRAEKSSVRPAAAVGNFDSDLLVLTHNEGPRLPVVSTLAVTRALRGAVLKHAHEQFCGCRQWHGEVPAASAAAGCYAKIPTWVSGHDAQGQALRDGKGHLAIVPLPFVSREHADGHLLGVALAFPRWVDRRERGRVLGQFLLDAYGTARPVKLALGPLGTWTIQKRDWMEHRNTLRPESWTAHPDGACTWASVTPVVLDKFPKADHAKPNERMQWETEAREIVAEACERIGFPKPAAIDLDTTSWHLGSPRAIGKRRPLRGHTNRMDAALGDGFPPYPSKGSGALRLQLHVWLHFAQPVIGPVILGAGRYFGYGLCKPWKGDPE